jgi:LAO/AO transport system kinase
VIGDDGPVPTPRSSTRKPVDVPALAAEVREGSRAAVSRAITLVESTRPDHRGAARHLMAELGSASSERLVPRVGISGVPGVGKSTFIESLGKHLIAEGATIGVLAVDPSSIRTGGSVLGDKTRMATLAADRHAYVRPSPSAGTLGGVAKATAQAMVVLEAAGFDLVLVETVGVGQSEVTVAGMVDTFLFLTLARTGDQLQGIKKGILEIADVIAVNKSDDREAETRAAAKELAGALHFVHKGRDGWVPPVLTCSGLGRRACSASGRGSSWTSRGPWSVTSSSSGCATHPGSRRSAKRSSRRSVPGSCPRPQPRSASSPPSTPTPLVGTNLGGTCHSLPTPPARSRRPWPTSQRS